MDLVHDRGSMDPVHESGPWTRSKEGVHGPLVPVLSSPQNHHDLLRNMSFTVFVCTPTWRIATVVRTLVTWVKTENTFGSKKCYVTGHADAVM